MFNDGHRSPCMGCDKRQVGCHSTCETYIAYKAEIETQNEERRQKAKLSRIYVHSITSALRTLKRD